MRTKLVSLAAFAALLGGLLVLTAPRASATPAVAANATELGRLFAAHFTDAQNGWALADLIAEEPRITAWASPVAKIKAAVAARTEATAET